MPRYPRSIVWFRRDLRLDDHVALLRAAERSAWVACAFVLDPDLLRGPRVGAPIVQGFFDGLRSLRDELRAAGSDLTLLEGDSADELLRFAARVGASAVFFNLDYDPDAVARDERVTRRLRESGLSVHASTDHVYFAAGDVVQDSGKPYRVFTRYRTRWTARLAERPNLPVPSARAALATLLPRPALGATRPVPAPEDYGHASSAAYPRVGAVHAHRALAAFLAQPVSEYAVRRNIPAVAGTSRLSPQLRAGTIGIRTLVNAALERRRQAHSPQEAANVDAWLGELVWRDFYQQLLAQYPRVAREPFLENARAIAYADDPAAFAAWCEGRTGYPIVDAAMTQLRATGWMHNRLRMIAASFLTKHLLIDYRHGERWFEQHLADADLAANNGGWQWAASTGTDAAPYFRVFNPTLQGKTYDPTGAFVRSMLPALARVPDRYVHEPWSMPPLLQSELGCITGRDYPVPIVEHAFARARAIAVYGAALARPRPF
jgi:deoxyribodipyrimidine photo-lyase